MNTAINCCGVNDNYDSYQSLIGTSDHWYQRYECGIYYLCTYGLYCPLEEPGDFCCAYASFDDPEVATKDEADDIDNSLSNSKGSKLLS